MRIHEEVSGISPDAIFNHKSVTGDWDEVLFDDFFGACCRTVKVLTRLPLAENRT